MCGCPVHPDALYRWWWSMSYGPRRWVAWKALEWWSWEPWALWDALCGWMRVGSGDRARGLDFADVSEWLTRPATICCLCAIIQGYEIYYALFMTFPQILSTGLPSHHLRSPSNNCKWKVAAGKQSQPFGAILHEMGVRGPERWTWRGEGNWWKTWNFSDARIFEKGMTPLQAVLTSCDKSTVSEPKKTTGWEFRRVMAVCSKNYLSR